MIIRRHRTLTVNVAQYETVEIGAAIEFDTEDEPDAQEDPEGFANDWLNRLLEEEIDEAAKVTTNSKSFVSDYRYTDTDTDTSTPAEDRK